MFVPNQSDDKILMFRNILIYDNMIMFFIHYHNCPSSPTFPLLSSTLFKLKGGVDLISIQSHNKLVEADLFNSF